MVINFFNFFRHYKCPPFHTVIRIHLFSLSYHILVILPSHFRSVEQMLMLMFYNSHNDKIQQFRNLSSPFVLYVLD